MMPASSSTATNHSRAGIYCCEFYRKFISVGEASVPGQQDRPPHLPQSVVEDVELGSARKRACAS
jgi:hypothetical protein